MSIAILKAHAVNFIQNFQAHRFVSQPDNPAFPEKQGRLELGQVEAEIAQCRPNLVALETDNSTKMSRSPV